MLVNISVSPLETWFYTKEGTMRGLLHRSHCSIFFYCAKIAKNVYKYYLLLPYHFNVDNLISHFNLFICYFFSPYFAVLSSKGNISVSWFSRWNFVTQTAKKSTKFPSSLVVGIWVRNKIQFKLSLIEVLFVAIVKIYSEVSLFCLLLTKIITC